MSKKILFVDDDPNILRAYQRGLRKQFQVEIALGGESALAMIDPRKPYAVIVSDMRMPGMDGIQFLTAVKKKAPDTVRMMLTGNADQQTAMAAVNEGSIFRFLTKPCLLADVGKALTAGIEQYELVTAEKELIGKTLRGSIKVLNDVLALSNPTAFGHASRLRRLAGQMCKPLKVAKTWEFEIAAMLSQIGCVTIPTETLNKIYRCETLSPEEKEMFESHPKTGHDLVANIPRLEGVAKIIAYQQKGFDGSGVPADDVAGKDIPLGARVLKAALDFDAAQSSGLRSADAVIALREHEERYDPEVLAALEAAVGVEEKLERREIRVKDFATGMLLAEDVKTTEGIVVVSKGQEVNASLCERIRNFARHRTIVEPVAVLVRADAAPLAVGAA